MRRYAELKPSKGTVIPPEMRIAVLHRDGGCIGRWRNFPTECSGGLEVDHVRASHGMGMKSRTELDNLVALCGACHRWKTEHGREARELLLDYLAWVYPETGECEHVDPSDSCLVCLNRGRATA